LQPNTHTRSQPTGHLPDQRRRQTPSEFGGCWTILSARLAEHGASAIWSVKRSQDLARNLARLIVAVVDESGDPHIGS
jgi:hypothetical protein